MSKTGRSSPACRWRTATDLWAGAGRRVPAASWRPASPGREACPGSS